jgi:glyoxylase-like metal-dependent hydrolase (beta-lactamase superfamily II)
LIKNPPVEIAPQLWMLGTTEYPFYLYRGRTSATLFEGGIRATGPVLRQQLQQVGVPVESVRQLVVTHAHPDHVMAVPAVRQMCPGIQVLASEPAAKTLAVEKAVAFFCRMDEALTGSLLRAGLVPDPGPAQPLAENRIAVDRVLRDGEIIAVDDGVAFQVLATPGHSDCLLSFYEPAAKVLLISDATGYYLPDCDYSWPNYFSDYGAYVRSLERLLGLEAEVLGLSHNAVIRGADAVAAYLRNALAVTQEYHQRIVTDAKAGKPARAIAEALGAAVYEKTQLMPLDFFQKNCGLLVKNSLRHEGLSAE